MGSNTKYSTYIYMFRSCLQRRSNISSQISMLNIKPLSLFHMSEEDIITFCLLSYKKIHHLYDTTLIILYLKLPLRFLHVIVIYTIKSWFLLNIWPVQKNLTSSSIRTLLFRFSIQAYQVHQYHKMHQPCKFGEIRTSYNQDIIFRGHLQQKLYPALKTLTSSSIRNQKLRFSIQACRVHQYHNAHHQCKFSNVRA